MKPLREENIETDVEKFQPLSDFVLVKRADGPHVDTFLVMPEGRSEHPGLRQGIAVRVGPGDRIPNLLKRCHGATGCKALFWVWGAKTHVPGTGLHRCPKCGSLATEDIAFEPNRRWSMNVKPGDTVIYTRAPANDVVLNGEEYVLLHEEQHVFAVIEKEAA